VYSAILAGLWVLIRRLLRPNSSAN
jgi:hypothetical protein